MKKERYDGAEIEVIGFGMTDILLNSPDSDELPFVPAQQQQ